MRPPTLEVFPSRNIRPKCHKNYTLSFKQPQTSLAITPTSKSKSPKNCETNQGIIEKETEIAKEFKKYHKTPKIRPLYIPPPK